MTSQANFFHYLLNMQSDSLQPERLSNAEDNAMLSPEDLFYNEEGYALLVPVMIGREALSVFYVSSTKKGRRFNEDDMVVLRTMTNSIAGVLARI